MTERDLFIAALQRDDPAARRVYLAEACESDGALRARMEELLAVHDRAASFLESPPAGPAVTADLPSAERPGSVIGPYRLMEQIGEGGMGLVFVAQQSVPVRRKVALKVIKPGMDTRAVVARFEAERQALALMDHPNIAKVFDGGATDTGRPYFVMEIVKGVPITEFCDQNRLRTRERLELFLYLCRAVQHAHQKGVIHRDLKPSNVLVASHDDTPVVKVIDFGVAKAVGQQLTDKTVYTQFAQLVGTPLYMSPEQAGQSSLDVDTRSDIYSLGVLLYELLTGTTPFDKERLRTAAFDEIRRIIREEEPARPSTRVSTMGAGATAASANRRSDPRQLSRLFRGELDWVVMKALEKDRNRRYESASALAADVERYLRDEPVHACPPSAFYRFRKFARRNKRGLATAALLGLMLSFAVGAVVASALWAAVQAEDRLKLEAAHKRELERNLYHTHIALAERELATNNPGRAEELIEGCPEHLRGWEWHYLKRLRHTPPLTLALGERQIGGTGFGLDFSPDGRLLAAPCGGHAVKVWDAATGDEVLTLRGHAARVLRVAFSPDGRSLASAGEDAAVLVWDFAGGGQGPRLTLTGHAGPVGGLAFSPDGRRLASAGHDRRVRVWDASTGDLLHTFPGEYTRYHYLNVAFAPPDGRRLAAPGPDNTVKVWDVETGQEVVTLRGHTEPVFGVFFSPDGRRLISLGFDDHAVRVWDLSGGGVAPEVRVLTPGHSRGAWSAAFSPDGRLVAVAGGLADGNVRLHDAATGELVHTLRAHIDRVISVAFSPDGSRVASTSFDRTVKVWEAETGREVLTLRGHADSVSRAVFSPNGGRHLASAGVDGTLRVWNATPLGGDGHRHARALAGHTGVVYGVAFGPGGRLATASADRTVKVWEAETGRELFTLRGHTDAVLCVAFSPDGRRLASGGVDRAVRIWDAETGGPAGTLSGFHGPVRSLAFGPGGRLATCGGLQIVQVWDAATGRETATLRGHRDFVYGVAVSPDGRHVATAGSDLTVRVWDAGTGAAAIEALVLPGRATCVAFSPDGRRLACGDTSQEVRVWDWAARAEVRRFSGHTNHIFGLAFSPDGRHLASASWAEVIVRDLESPDGFRRPGGHAGTIWGVAFGPDGRRLAVAGGYKGKGEVRVLDAALWAGGAGGGR